MWTLTRSLVLFFLLASHSVCAQSAVAITQQERILVQQCIDSLANGAFTATDLRGWKVLSRQVDERNARVIVHIQQTCDSIPVYGVVHAIAIKGDRAYALPLSFIPELKRQVNTSQATTTPIRAVEAAMRHAGLQFDGILRDESGGSNSERYVVPLGNALNRPARVRLCYQPWKQAVRLAWDVNLDMRESEHWWNIRVDAVTGMVIAEDDWTVSCQHNHSDAMTIPDPAFPTPPTVAQYTVFPYPVESPIHGSRQVLSDPSLLSASPFGWHDTSGTQGADFTITRGNNVYAYEDANNDDLPGFSPDGGPTLIFNYPFHIDSSATFNRSASVSNLFYTSNALHDVLWQHGFDEQSGNFQWHNYGRGGIGGDEVMAEGLDGGGTNNANFATPDDGLAPRMQMYLWNGAGSATCSSLGILSPATIAGNKSIGFASYNPPQNFNITSNLILANDGIGTLTDGCSAYTNAAAVAGKIVVVDRGSCTFLDKTFYAQQAGASAILIVNNVTSTSPPSMSGLPGFTVTIPTLSLLFSEGSGIKSQLNSGNTVSGRLIYCRPGAQRDGSFDNGIIAHEYGHGVSNRLTGGPAASSCLYNIEQGGEGWSDWLCLITTIEPGDQGASPRGIGTFALGQPVSGGGIRRYPYSTNMSVNPQTYADVAGSTSVHQRGEIWCDAIWDMTWFLIRDFGLNPTLTAAGDDSSGNIVAMRLVLEGMKLQPCSPGYIDARDAILLADDILYSSKHRCQIWEAFSRRGMGYYASQGSSNAIGDETVDFTYPPFCLAPTVPPLAGFTADVFSAPCPGTIRFSDQSTGNPQQWQWDFGDGTTSSRQNPEHTYAQPGNYTVRLKAMNSLGSDSLEQVAYITITGYEVQVSASPSSICAGDTIQLSTVISGNNAVSGYSVTSIPYAPLSPSASTTAIPLSDDQVSGLQGIGFDFYFFGEKQTSFAISSNGFIGFSAALANGCCTGQHLPSISAPNGLISLAWNDLNPSVSGSLIDHFLVGSPPNRKRIIRYNTNHYNGPGYPMNGQIVLFEGSNIVELHVQAITFVNATPTTIGIENAKGTKAFTPPGRNAATFSTANESWRFTPYAVFQRQWTEPVSSWADTVSSPSLEAEFPDSVQVYVTDANGCGSSGSLLLPVQLCDDSASVQVSLFLEGYFTLGQEMNPALYNSGLSNDPAACDSIFLEFRSDSSPYGLIHTASALLRTDGLAELRIPASLFAQRVFLVVRTRNGISTWSKVASRISGNTVFNYKQ
ncbi:MAG: M36 family metallopeptidase [Bacteroidota bacterium]